MNNVYLVLITPEDNARSVTIDSVHDTRAKAEIRQQDLWSSQKFNVNEVVVVEMPVL